MSFGRRVLISLLGAAASASLLAAPAMAASGGQVAAFGSHGTAAGQLNEPFALGVDKSDNSVFVLDFENTPANHYELKKYSAGVEVGKAEIPRAVGGVNQRLTGIAVDGEKGLVYLLASRTAESTSEEIYVFETTQNGSGKLVSPVALGASGTIAIPNAAKPLNNPFAIALDPSTHDVVVAAHTGTSAEEEGEVVVQKITQAGAAGPRFTKEGSFFRPEEIINTDGLAISGDGTTFVSSGGGAASLRIYKIPVAYNSIEEAGSLLAARTSEGFPAGGDGNADPPAFAATANSKGSQIDVSPDGKTLYFAQEFHAEVNPAPASILVRAFSLQEGKTTALYGDGETSCLITVKQPAVAAGGQGDVFVLEHNNSEKTRGARVVEVGPTGSGCPAPSASFSIDGSEADGQTVEKGQTVSMLAYNATANGGANSEILARQLHGAYPTALTWNVTGPEPFTAPATPAAPGLALPLELEHQFLKGGTYTVKLEVETGFLVGGSSASASKTLVVQGTAPTAFFVASTTAPVVGQSVTFDASGSSDPILGPLTGAQYHWEFGDGATEESSVPTISHTYAAPGERTVTLIVKNEGLSSAPFAETLVVQPASSSGTPPGGGGDTGGGGGGGGSTPPPPGNPSKPTPTKPGPAKPKPTPLQKALANCIKEKGKAKVQCVKQAKKKFSKKPKGHKSKGHKPKAKKPTAKKH